MKKICIFLCLVLIATLLPMPAASAIEGAGYVTDSEAVEIGDTFTVDIAVKNNPGIISLRLNIIYDENALSLKSVSDKGLFKGFTTPAPAVSSPYTLRWADSLATKNNTSDGTFVTLTFKALKTGVTTVTVEHKEARSCQGRKIDFSDRVTKITVKEATCSHKYKETVTKQATCTEKGIKTFTCELCKHSYTSVIALKEHSFIKKVIAPDCLNKGYTEERCKNCNSVKKYAETPARGHCWGGWKTKAPATVQTEGIEVRQCSVCLTVQERKTAKLSDAAELTVNENARIKCISDDSVMMTAGLTVKELLGSINGSAVVLNKDSSPAKASDVLCTSMKIVMTDTDGKSKDIVVFGDIDGDGTVSATDARLALRASVELEGLSAAQKNAADTDFGKTVAAADARTILRLSVKLENSTALLGKAK